jgi:hypothetical protein
LRDRPPRTDEKTKPGMSARRVSKKRVSEEI